MTDLSRYADWTDWLAARAEADADVRCLWVGGSAATGGYDEWSDLDVVALCRPGLLLEPTRLVDLAVLELAEHHSHLDVRRHGTPVVLYDPASLIVLADEDVSATLAEAVEQVRQRRVTGEWLVNRALRRGHLAEAVDLYLRFPLAGVVRLVRVEHCPWRHDYGLRYLREDLPAEVAERVESLVPGVGRSSLEELSAACYAWLDELLAADPSITNGEKRGVGRGGGAPRTTTPRTRSGRAADG